MDAAIFPICQKVLNILLQQPEMRIQFFYGTMAWQLHLG
jgi:hypothetical protein